MFVQTQINPSLLALQLTRPQMLVVTPQELQQKLNGDSFVGAMPEAETALPGGFLNSLASNFGTSEDLNQQLLEVLQQLLQVLQSMGVPSDSDSGSPPIEPVGDGTDVASSAGSEVESYPPVPQGPHAATSDITSQEAWVPVDAPTTNAAGNRSADAYSQVIDQFDVENNPRYAQRDGNTYCNIFAWDVTRAMGAEIPHYREDGSEMDANGVADWLAGEGEAHGWHPVSEQEAQAMANQGKPVVVSWKNEGGIGHIGVVRPGEMGENGPNLAQAGAVNTNHAHVHDNGTFGNVDAIYYAHE